MDMLILQKYIRATLAASPALSGLIGSRIYDRIPVTGKLPYVRIGVDEGNDQSIRRFKDWAIIASIHIWSRAVGFPEGKRIATTITGLLPRNPVMLDAYSPAIMRLQTQRWLPDPDQSTLHGVLEYEARYGVY